MDVVWGPTKHWFEYFAKYLSHSINDQSSAVNYRPGGFLACGSWEVHRIRMHCILWYTCIYLALPEILKNQYTLELTPHP